MPKELLFYRTMTSTMNAIMLNCSLTRISQPDLYPEERMNHARRLYSEPEHYYDQFHASDRRLLHARCVVLHPEGAVLDNNLVNLVHDNPRLSS